jgi:hypothetical protein
MSQIHSFIDQTHLGACQSYKALGLWPLIRTPGGEPGGLEYVSLADALEDGFVGIDEVSDDGSVPSVRVDNRGRTAVLVIFGEEIRGAKQNRVANASFLLPAQQVVDIDVSCVEQGRWGRRPRAGSQSAGFEESADLISSVVRRKMALKVASSREARGRFDADQGEVWHNVTECLRSSGAPSDTMAYADYVGTRAHDLEDYSEAFHPVEGQLGFVASIGGEVVGIEAIGNARVFARVFPKLVRAYAIDAIDSERLRGERSRVHFEAPEPFLAAVAAAPVRTEGPSLGLGDDLRLGSEVVEACALAFEGELVHLTGFPAPQEASEAPF